MIDPRLHLEHWTLLCKRFTRELDSTEAKAYRTWLEARGVDTDEWERAFESVYGTAKFWPEPGAFLAPRFNRDWWVATQMLNGRFEHYQRFSQIGRDAWASLGGTDPHTGLGKVPMAHARRHFLDACVGMVQAADATGLLPDSPATRRRLSSGGRTGLTAIEVGSLLPPSPSGGSNAP